MGFALVFAGSKGVVWYKPRPTFPYVEGFVPVALSWVISPLAAAATSALLFCLIRVLVLRRPYSPRLGMLVSWLSVG
jgi:sodium-dependent phosphate transporter